MKNLYRFASIVVVTVVSLAGCATPRTQVAQTGPDDYTMVKRTELLSNRSDKLKADVETEALALCKARGQALSMLDSRTVDPDPPGYASATISFRCVPI